MSAAEIANQIVDCFKSGGKLMICGNGGSASMAQHMAAELVCSFENKDRIALPAMALTTDSSILTAWPNDQPDGFEDIFARQVQALVRPGDILLAFSSSGKSRNCLRAMNVAKVLQMETIDFPRRGDNTSSVQEFQLKLMHDVCRIVERAFI